MEASDLVRFRYMENYNKEMKRKTITLYQIRYQLQES